MWGIPVPSRVPSSGLGWGKEIRSGSGVPADALGSLGDRYFDTTAQRWYLKRWVAKIDSAALDSVFAPVGVQDATGAPKPWKIDIILRKDVAGGTSQGVWFDGGSSVFESQMVINPTAIAVRTGNGANASIGRPVGRFFRAVGGYDGANSYVSVLGSTGTAAVGTIAAPRTQSRILGGSDAPILIAGLKVYREDSILYSWSMQDGAGAVVTDDSGNGNQGALTDGSPTTFWSQAWVPMDLL